MVFSLDEERRGELLNVCSVSHEFEALSTGDPAPCTSKPWKAQGSYLHFQKKYLQLSAMIIRFLSSEMFW